ncbi:MAG: DNA repair protein RadA [Frankiales bacterium]|nr:DNA repair protein RadA [Frankiales bacterium]
MAKTATRERPAFRCDECGLEVAKWVGRCPECQAWGTIAELGAARSAIVAPGPVTAPALRIADVSVDDANHRPTGVAELDRVLGGGLVPGSVVLLAGEPGVGKSTLLVTAAARIAQSGRRCLVVTGEESAAQVRLRAGRIDALADDLYVAAETDLAALLGHVDAVRPEVLVVDSVQTISTAAVEGTSGGVAQVREVAAALTRVAKERRIATVLVGHVTKEGAIAGPRVLEHLVDVVLHFEGDRHSRLRLVRTVKNRYGPADEVGCFDLTDRGIVGLPDPSGLFLSRVADPVPGTCVTVAMEGRRALVSEVQALVVPINTPNPRRATSGLDAARVAMMLAVLDRRGGQRIGTADVYAATVGGVRLAEPAADLAIALAFASAIRDRPLPGDVIAVGEVGLAGEVRPVGALVVRLQEAARLGFRRALVPEGCQVSVPGMQLLEVSDLRSALLVLNDSVSTRRPANVVPLDVAR